MHMYMHVVVIMVLYKDIRRCVHGCACRPPDRLSCEIIFIARVPPPSQSPFARQLLDFCKNNPVVYNMPQYSS